MDHFFTYLAIHLEVDYLFIYSFGHGLFVYLFSYLFGNGLFISLFTYLAADYLFLWERIIYFIYFFLWTWIIYLFIHSFGRGSFIYLQSQARGIYCLRAPTNLSHCLKENKLGMFKELPTEINSVGPKQRENTEQSLKSVQSEVRNQGRQCPFPGLPLQMISLCRHIPHPLGDIPSKPQPGSSSLGLGFWESRSQAGPAQGEMEHWEVPLAWDRDPGNPGALGMQGQHPVPTPQPVCVPVPVPVPRAANTL